MRVTVVGPVAPFRGGIAQHTGRLVTALRAAGHTVDVVSFASQYPAWLYGHEQTDVRLAPVDDARYGLRWWSPFAWRRAGASARTGDLLVFPWVTPFHAPGQRLMIGAARGTPVVALVHNPLPHEPTPWATRWTRWVLSRVDGAVVHAERGREDLARIAATPNIVAVPMPPLIDVEARPLPPRPPLCLLFLGFVRPYKGLDIAIAALEQLVQRGVDARLTVAGEFWEPVERWRERVNASPVAGFAERVDLRPGFVGDQEVDRLLAEHHLLVAPYRSATQSGVVPLAFAAGRPVVATRVGGLAERVREGVNGTLAQVDDPVAFADAIQRADEKLDELARAAREEAADWGAVAAAVIAAGGLGVSG